MINDYQAILPQRIHYSSGLPTLRTSPLRNNSLSMVQIMDPHRSYSAVSALWCRPEDHLFSSRRTKKNVCGRHRCHYLSGRRIDTRCRTPTRLKECLEFSVVLADGSFVTVDSASHPHCMIFSLLSVMSLISSFLQCSRLCVGVVLVAGVDWDQVRAGQHFNLTGLTTNSTFCRDIVVEKTTGLIISL
jgi:hypothetical protein